MSARPGAHFLLVGDGADLGTLRGIVDRLPVDAYGQIFVEVATRAQVRRWDVPAGMTVSWLRRDRVASLLGGLAPRGELVARAVTAWVAEWIPEERSDRALPYVLWIGCSASDQVDRLYRHLARRFGNLHLHHPHTP
jgi:NADPH-dependent ferric siderophore reductase